MNLLAGRVDVIGVLKWLGIRSIIIRLDVSVVGSCVVYSRVAADPCEDHFSECYFN